MATNKFFKSLLFALTIAVNLFGFCVQDSSAYPVFAQQSLVNSLKLYDPFQYHESPYTQMRMV